MDNVTSTSLAQTNQNTDNPINAEATTSPLTSEPATTSTSESVLPNSSEPIPTVNEYVEQTNVDGNVEAHVDFKYEAHDVALESAKTNGHQQINGFKASENHKIDIDDCDQHPEKSEPCYSMLNKLFLALAIVCFLLLLVSIGYIINHESNGPFGRGFFSYSDSPHPVESHSNLSEILINESYFNITHRNKSGMIVVLARRGASVHNILIPSNLNNQINEYRSIVVQGNSENYFGSVRFGFNDPKNTMNITHQLPDNYPYLNSYKEDWKMYADTNNPHRVRFVKDSIEIIYEISLDNSNEFMMKTMVSTPSNQKIIADLTNNIYFNLRGHGNLSTHHLNLSLSSPIDILSGQTVEKDRLIQSQRVDKLSNVNNYFYKLDLAGIGKNYIATLLESETNTIMRLFSDHAGVIIDPSGVGSSHENHNNTTAVYDMHGVRISPRQSPVYQPMPIYGPILIVYPSEAIHSTWWQFDYEN